jgi:hypothetical protein
MTCFCGVLDDLKICGLKRNNEKKSSTKGTENRIVNTENWFEEKLSMLVRIDAFVNEFRQLKVD